MTTRPAILALGVLLLSACGDSDDPDASPGDASLDADAALDGTASDADADTGPPPIQDECALGIDDCPDDAICVDDMVGFHCECTDGLIGDGRACGTRPVAHRLAVGTRHMCWIDAAGAMHCVGQNQWAQLGSGGRARPPDDRAEVALPAPAVEVAAGTRASCAVLEDGRLYCWGNNPAEWDVEQVGTDTDWRIVRAAHGNSGVYYCGTKGAGELWCWGSNIAGIRSAISASPRRVGTRDDFVEVALGDTAACGIVADGTIHCWGIGIDGLVGDGGMTEVPEPVAITSGLRFERLTVGDAVGCGITDVGALHCWGASRLWDPMSTRAPTPVQVGDRDDWVDVAAAGAGFCAVQRSGAVQCVGQLSPQTRQLLGFETMPAPEPTVAIARGGFVNVCGVGVSGAIHCQGANEQGQLGLRTRGDQAVPTPVATRETFGRLTGGGFETCGLTPAGALYCWGELQADDGMLTLTSVQVPTAQSPGRTFDFLWAHEDIRFAIDASGALFVFGIGRPTTGITGTREWTQVGDMTGWTRVAAHRDSHACGIRAGELWCWGPGSGSIGDPDPSEIDTPRRIGTDADWVAVAVEDRRTCGIRSGGALYCFGAALTEIAPGTAFERIVLIEDKACGVASGSVLCWGDNMFEELVPGGARTVSVPTAVDARTDWTDVALTRAGTCGIRAGELHCWGQSPEFLVDPTAPSRYTGIERIGTDADWESIMGAEMHWCTVKRDGRASCWGASDRGAVGNGEVWRDELTAVVP